MQVNQSAIPEGIVSPQSALSFHRLIDDRMVILQKRIEAGVEKGGLTADEASQFTQALSGIVDKMQSLEEADGWGLTIADRIQVHKDLNHLSRQIAEARHDEG